MALKNHTLIIDGAYFIFSRLYVLPRQKVPAMFGESSNIDTRFMSSESEMGIFMRKLSMDFASEIRKFKNITNRIVFTLDSKSWRKDLFPNAEYKANRVQDSKICWENIKKVTDEFTALLAQQGVIIHRSQGAEGDDLIYAWSVSLSDRGENTIVWSGDTDLMQLVNFNKSTNSYTIWYDNTRSRIAAYPGFNKYLENNDADKKDEFEDIFNTDTVFLISNQVKQEIKNFINSNGLSVSEIYCDDYVFVKILTGDKSDNIKSVYSVEKVGKTGKPRTSKISEEKAKSILETFKKRFGRFSAMYLFEQSYKTDICKIIASEMKITDHASILPNLEQNTNLILLHSSTIPETLQSIVFGEIEVLIEKKDLQIANILTKESILQDTKYISSEYKNDSSAGSTTLF
jgi:5'-3' exonuclease